MKYSHPNPTPFRVFLVTFGASSIFFLAVLIAMAAALTIIFPSPWVGFLSGVVAMLFAGAFAVSIGSVATQTKLLQEGGKQFDWMYDITTSKLTMSALDKVKITYERDGLKAIIVRPQAIIIKHVRGTCVLPLPKEQRQEILETLRKLGWIEDKPRANKVVNGIAIAAVWVLVAAVACIVLMTF